MRRIVRPVLGLLLALLVVVPGCVLLNLGDPPIDDSDLRFTGPDPSSNPQNGLHRFDEAAAMLWWPEARSGAIEEMLKGENWDEELVGEILRRNEEVLTRIPELIAVPMLALPRTRLGVENQQETERVLAWPRFSRVLALQAASESRRGNANASREASVHAVRLGARIQRAEGSNLLYEMTAVAVKTIGLESVARNLARNPITHADSQGIDARLRGLYSDAEARAPMWAREYESMAELVDGIREQEPPPDTNWYARTAARIPYHFKPNATKALYADFYRRQQRTSRLPCLQQPAWPIPELTAWERLKMVVGPNGIGEMLFYAGTPNFKRFQLRHCSVDTRLSATIAMIALVAHEQEHGTVPETLSALIPRYLSKVPTDAFDGAPIAYDRETRTLGKAREITFAPTQWTVPTPVEIRAGVPDAP